MARVLRHVLPHCQGNVGLGPVRRLHQLNLRRLAFRMVDRLGYRLLVAQEVNGDLFTRFGVVVVIVIELHFLNISRLGKLV